MSSNNNRINIPEAKQAMEQFKMQAANDQGVPATYRNPDYLHSQIQNTRNQRYAHRLCRIRLSPAPNI